MALPVGTAASELLEVLMIVEEAAVEELVDGAEEETELEEGEVLLSALLDGEELEEEGVLEDELEVVDVYIDVDVDMDVGVLEVPELLLVELVELWEGVADEEEVGWVLLLLVLSLRLKPRVEVLALLLLDEDEDGLDEDVELSSS